MFSKEISDIIIKYQSNMNELTTINSAIIEVIYQLTSINSNISERLQFLVNNLDTCDEEEQLLSDSRKLRKYISTLKEIECCESALNHSMDNNIPSSSKEQYTDDIMDLYICHDNICPVCNWKMNESSFQYEKINSSEKLNGIVTIQTCSGCNKNFIIDYDLDGIDISNTNIRLHQDYYTVSELSFSDIIVLTTLSSCIAKEHKIMDVIAKIPIIKTDGSIVYLRKNVAYCKDCDKYIMLKNDFIDIEGRIACQVIDKTIIVPFENDNDEIEISQKQSLLYQYGYNVKAKDNLSDKQRHLILALIVEAGILTRTQISSHLDTLIERGSKIPKWKDATNKWKQDRYYVCIYNTKNLPKIVSEKLVLKYRRLAYNP